MFITKILLLLPNYESIVFGMHVYCIIYVYGLFYWKKNLMMMIMSKILFSYKPKNERETDFFSFFLSLFKHSNSIVCVYLCLNSQKKIFFFGSNINLTIHTHCNYINEWMMRSSFYKTKLLNWSSWKSDFDHNIHIKFSSSSSSPKKKRTEKKYLIILNCPL